LFQKILVPIVPESNCEEAMNVARAVGEGRIILVGLVGIAEDESLGVAPPLAKNVRECLRAQSGESRVRIRERVRVSHSPWQELERVIEEEKPDLLILEWQLHFESLRVTLAEVLGNPPCDLALVRGPIPARPRSILVSLRGSIHAEQALRVSLVMAETCGSRVASLHVVGEERGGERTPAFRGIQRVLENLPDVEQIIEPSDDVAGAILANAARHELVVMGSTARREDPASPLGSITERVLRESKAGVIVVRTARAAIAELESEVAGQAAISILVDKWFAENTYYADEFANLGYLLELKQRQGVSVSLALPALNEEATVGTVIETVKEALMDSTPLLDEIVLMDSDSTDRTREIAQRLEVPVFVHQRVLPGHGARRGKGEALWKSLYMTRGDIILWIDTDIVNIHPRFVYGLLGPLLLRTRTQFVKGFYRRPLKVGDKIQAGGGGRVTELTARPLLNLFYPELSGIIQPLSGEYGGRRSALEQLPFSSGYGVEIGMLIDVFERYGLSAIAQVDLQERVHHNQPLESLSKMSFAIIQTVMRKLERRYSWDILDEVNRTMKLIRYEPGRFFLEVEEIAERERPPMCTLPEYQERKTA
jgi:glucosyl-3-phosphoglycerate synthase